MHAEGEAYRRRHNITAFPVFTRGIYCDLPPARDRPVSLQAILNKHTDKVRDTSASRECTRRDITAFPVFQGRLLDHNSAQLT